MNAARNAKPRRRWKTRTSPQQGRLYRADDNGPGVELDPSAFGGSSEEGWGRAYESFRRLNEDAFTALDVAPRFESTTRGPVLARLRVLLEQLKRGFDFKEATPQAPRGTIQWSKYLRTSLPSGRWHQVPCRFPDLSTDPILRGAIRWTLERVLEELGLVAGADRVALGLRTDAMRLLEQLVD